MQASRRGLLFLLSVTFSLPALAGSYGAIQPSSQALSPHAVRPVAAASSRAPTPETVPAALVPALASALAAESPDVWNARGTAAGELTFDNPTQHLSAGFNSQGVRLQLRANPQAQLSLQLVGIENGAARHALKRARLSARGNRVELVHGHGVTEWYVNGPLGLEHGFTIAEPAGAANSLALTLKLAGNLVPTLRGDDVEFRDGAGQSLLHYGKLLAYDASHRSLPAEMQLQGRSLRVQIDTRDAQFPITVDPLFTTVAILNNPEPGYRNSFGFSVALSADGNTALIGAPYTTLALGEKPRAGAAYLFIRGGNIWYLAKHFYAPTTVANEYFGWSVALSADGKVALIGAPYTTVSVDYRLGEHAAGAAYVSTSLDGISWSDSFYTVTAPVPTANDNFGWSVALSADGNTALVGAPYVTVYGKSQAGAAFKFVHSDSYGSSRRIYIAATPAAYDYFGYSVALSADGNTALIGAPRTVVAQQGGAGAAHVFSYGGGNWPLAQTLTVPTPAAGDYFGWSVSLSADANGALVGAWGTTVSGQPRAGAAYAFTHKNGNWSAPQTFSVSPPRTDDSFGYRIALSGDGNTALIGAFGTKAAGLDTVGAAYAFTATPEPAVDLSLAITSNPSSVMVGNTMTYMLTAANNDTQTSATNVTLSVPLPTGMSYLSGNGAGGSCNLVNGTVTCTLASLAPQASWQPSITVTATTVGSISATASVSADQPDLNLANNSATVTTNVTVSPPVAANGSVTTNAGTAVNGTLAATGTGPLTFAIVAQPGHGTASITNAATGAFTYTPASGYSGSDSFTFTASNSGGASNTATESVTVNAPLPAPPVAANGSVTTNAGTAVNGTLAATGTAPLTFAIVAQPGHGTVSLTDATAGTFTYTPASGFSGSDSFTFNASNAGGTSNTATHSITVIASSAGGGGSTPPPSTGGKSGGGGAFGWLSLLLLAPLARIRKRRA